MDSQIPAAFKQLSTAEKILFLQDLWDQVAAKPEDISVTQEQKDELDRRFEDLEKNPDEGESWESVKENLQKKS